MKLIRAKQLVQILLQVSSLGHEVLLIVVNLMEMKNYNGELKLMIDRKRKHLIMIHLVGVKHLKKLVLKRLMHKK